MKRRATATILLLLLQTCATLCIQDCPASSCCSTLNISYPFRLSGDPPHCGDKRYELHCENNHTLLTLFSGKFLVQHIDYKRYKIRVSDVGIAENATRSFMPRYFLYSGNFTHFVIGPGPDLFKLDSFEASVAYFNCSDPVNDDSRYTDVDNRYCGSRGNVYAVVKDSGNDFGVMDIKVGCKLIGATLANWGRAQKGKKIVSYADIHNMVSNGFVISWLRVACEDQCGKRRGCSILDESTGEVQCDELGCRYSYQGNTDSCDIGNFI
ncbi:hypothetical protein RJT34_16628 [Clitoria ternatea]|uniref:Wall-associated receptor kinase galacturonan-binding domain-containing protein n=1 Tax=Clitoria ternatea TaxID=43366 RepID=A0AAN9J7I9_CLITE